MLVCDASPLSFFLSFFFFFADAEAPNAQEVEFVV